MSIKAQVLFRNSRIQLLSIQNNHGSSVMRHSQISILRTYTIFSLTGSYLAKDFRIKLNLQTVVQIREKSMVTSVKGPACINDQTD